MTAYICTPYRADNERQFEKQLQYTKEVARQIVVAGHDVIVPHLYYPQFLNDDHEDERAFGMASAMNLIKLCDIVIVGPRHGISDGMRAEIEFAKEHDILLKSL